ncbi:uncharacterized protein LOC120352446 [Nilaparvata lugens]|uniref:uncharacterized protein LOC120352446 n=1 Tax=Nilaparvata lugens TaxID=108931 RepID=UPI00193CE09E|nr:uncharacterized protein LOC120352446 [Nilaparvata lugens]
MTRIVRCHQRIIRNLKTCSENSEFTISCVGLVIFMDSCTNAFFMLKSPTFQRAATFAFMFLCVNLVMFLVYQNGQHIFNQNEKLRKSLLKLPWIDKPRWLKQTVHVLVTQANANLEIRPYGTIALNYMSFKDLMKFTFSVGNVLYTRRQLASQIQ